jgi:hypothetical protein
MSHTFLSILVSMAPRDLGSQLDGLSVNANLYFLPQLSDTFRSLLNEGIPLPRVSRLWEVCRDTI